MSIQLPTPNRAILAFCLCLSLCGCGGNDKLRVGHIAPLTGNDRELGLASLRGVQLAVDELNAQVPASTALRIEVIHADSAGDKNFENQAVRLLSVNKTPILLGGDTTAEVQQVAPIVRSYGAALFTPAGVAGNPPNVFSLGLPIEKKIEAIEALLASEPATSSVVFIIDERHSDLATAANAVAESLSGRRFEHLKKRGFRDDKERKTLTVQPTDITVFFGTASDLVSWHTEGGPRAKLIFAGDEGEAARIAAARIDCILFGTTPVVPKTPAAISFAERFKKKYQTEPAPIAGRYFDAVQILYRSAKEAQSATFEKLVPKFKTIQYERLSQTSPTEPVRAYPWIIHDGKLSDADKR